MKIYAKILFILPFFISTCIQYHSYAPPLQGNSNPQHLSCVSSLRFKTFITGLMPDIKNDENDNVQVTPDKEEGKSSMALDNMTKRVISDYGILIANDREGIDVNKGLFVQINTHHNYSSLEYAWLLLTGMTLFVIPSHITITETFDISVFENGKFLFKKHYDHKVSNWRGLIFLPFFWMGEPLSDGQKYYKNVIHDTIIKIQDYKKKHGCRG